MALSASSRRATTGSRRMALIEEGLHRSEGRYLIGIPDMIENLDTLSALRGCAPAL